MKPDDLKFVREMNRTMRLVYGDRRDGLLDATYWVPTIKRLFTLLIESEGMRKKAEFYRVHLDLTQFREKDMDVDCFEEDGSACSNGKHDWSDTEWIKNAKENLLGE